MRGKHFGASRVSQAPSMFVHFSVFPFTPPPQKSKSSTAFPFPFSFSFLFFLRGMVVGFIFGLFGLLFRVFPVGTVT